MTRHPGQVVDVEADGGPHAHFWVADPARDGAFCRCGKQVGHDELGRDPALLAEVRRCAGQDPLPAGFQLPKRPR